MSVELFPGCTMTRVTWQDQSTQTMSIDELLEERLRERASKAERVLEEIKPEFEKALDEARDPVTYEIFEEPLLTCCTHTLDKETVRSIYNSNPRVDKDEDEIIDCPICRRECAVNWIYYDYAFKQVIGHLKKIWGIFNVSNLTNKSGSTALRPI